MGGGQLQSGRTSVCVMDAGPGCRLSPLQNSSQGFAPRTRMGGEAAAESDGHWMLETGKQKSS